MELTVLNSNFDEVDVVDVFKSLIWTERYYSYGDFELTLSGKDYKNKVLPLKYYFRKGSSDRLMIIEKINLTSNLDDGDTAVLSGRSLESILDRRIIWGLKIVSGNIQNVIKTLLDENVINPSNTDRKIPNFIFKESKDSEILKISIEAQYTGDNLYDVIQTLCEACNIGFRITLNDEKQFVFELYAGQDRTYSQNTNPYVKFSPEFDNLNGSNYMSSDMALKTVTLIGGEGEGKERRYSTVGGGTGLERRELFTDARDISSNVEDGKTLSDSEYCTLLNQRGNEKLLENVYVEAFEGSAEVTELYHYNIDFYIGDLVQIVNEYGCEGSARILEFVESEDNDGYSAYPTFKTT